MARMHSKKHGKAKSRKPIIDASKAGSNVDKKEIEKIIVNYAKKGMAPALIGETLKKEHKVPYTKLIFGKSITQILNENNIKTDLPYDLLDLIKKAVNMQKHLEKNKQDISNKVVLARAKAKIWRLTKYYISKGMLPQDWRYDPATAELLIKQK